MENKKISEDIEKMISGLEGIANFVETVSKKSLANMPKDQVVSYAQQLNSLEKAVKKAEEDTKESIKEIKRTYNV